MARMGTPAVRTGAPTPRVPTVCVTGASSLNRVPRPGFVTAGRSLGRAGRSRLGGMHPQCRGRPTRPRCTDAVAAAASVRWSVTWRTT
jgi:hypothetical protein